MRVDENYNAKTGTGPVAMFDGSDDRFSFLKQLGTGGTGTVWKAFDQRLDQIIAIKVLHDSLAYSCEAVANLHREVRLARQITHPNIAKIFDLHYGARGWYITMEYVDGRCLREVLGQGKTLDADDALRIARDICAGLAAVHAAEIVHRDVRPENILVAGDRSVLTDLGLAEWKREVIPTAAKSRGSILFLPPERDTLDPRADVFSLGLVMFAMLTGKHYLYERHPLAGTQTDFEIVPISDPGRYNSTLPTWLKDVVGRCLETEKAQRYQNAGDLAEALGIRGSLADATAAMSSTSNRDGPLVADAPEGGGPIGRGPSKVNPAPGRLRRGKTTAGRRSWRALVTGTAAVVLAVTSAMLWRTVAPHANKDAIILLPFEIQDTPLELRSALQAVARDVYDQLAENVSANIWQFDDETHAPLPSAIRTKAKLVVHGRIVCDGVHLVAHGAIESGTGHGRSSSSRVDGTPWDFWQFAERLQAAFLSDPMLRPYVGRMRGPKYLTMNPRAYALFCQADGIYHSTSTDAELHRALSMLHAAAKEDPRFTMAFVEEARINLKLYETNGDHKFLTEASDAAQRVFRREPGMEAARTVMADVFVAAGRADEAMRLLDDALPPTDSVFRWRSYGLRSLGAFKQAAASADSAVALNPLSVASYLILADCYAAQFQYGPAATAYSAALELDPNNIEALNGLGETMIRDGEFAAAIPSLQTYLRIRPDAVAYTNLGIAYFYSGQESLSLPLFEKAVNLEPDSDLCMGYLGQVYQLVGDSRAPQTFRRARELAYRRRQAAPSDASVVARLALYDAFLGHLPEAQVEADQATREDPSDKDVQYQFALVQTFVGKRDEAATVLRVLGESGYTLPFAPSNPDRKILNLIPGYLDMCTLYGRKTNRNNGAVLTNAGKSEGGSSSMLRPR